MNSHPRPAKILHIINDLSVGGAEMMLYKLLTQTDFKRFQPVVLSMVDRGPLKQRIEELGVPVYTLRMTSRIPSPGTLSRLRRIMRRVRPDLVQGWLFLGNLAAYGACFRSIDCLGRTPSIWNFRCTPDATPDPTALVPLAFKFSVCLSGAPSAIIYNSKVSSQQHEALGYPSAKTVLIPNGFDTQQFAPSPSARLEVRAELGLPEDTQLIGFFGRYHPMKDHANFLHAAALLRQQHPQVHFILAGRGIDAQNETLCALMDKLNLTKHLHLLGERHDMARLNAALDVATCCSAFGEGFPNIIGESMSCGVPCVVTDISDSAWIVGGTGRVVPPSDSQALANAWSELIVMEPHERELLGQAARRRVEEMFSIKAVTARYESLYEEVLAKHGITLP